MSHIDYRGGIGCLSFLFAFAGCTNDTVDLGGGRISQEIRRGSRCSDSAVVHGSVRVQRQSEIEALAGCEQVDGDLQVEIFAGADLSPLSSLRAVDGLLEIGTFPEVPDEGLDTLEFDALREQVDAIVANGYLASLAGLENLERVGSLSINSIAADNLEPLLGLRAAGLLGVDDAANLRDLHGLSNIANIDELISSNNPALSSLGGIQLGERLINLQIINSPLLSSLAELAPVGLLYSLLLSNLGISDLQELTSLVFVESMIMLADNRNLVNVDSLANVSTGELFVKDNRVLRSLPALPNMFWLEALTVVGNPELETISLDLPEHASGPYEVQGAILTNPIQLFDIGRNAQLTRVSLTAGLSEGRFLAIYENPALVSVDLGTLTRLGKLSLSDNAQLASVGLGALQTVESLSVLDNPKLDTAALAGVRTFETRLSGNAAQE